ncbi:hypothetical protein B0G62_109123 [Paraburkholderia eburnea]|uniref:Uncharacterized protein n=2 Tax=Paraburkholderia eburnea TaxID=1189126 RepID=A0A2S4M6E9_9BURK|nr:hypothetical protein B0G62_109123 [Paraburkholderia eburnea]PRZ20504.1 hypothetical protein BX588_11179 [Paraburkholderia eburnea]
MKARSPRRAVFVVAVIVAGFSVFQYIQGARARAKAHECVAVTSQSGRYRAQSCVTGMDGNVFFYVGRLYDAYSGEMLARTDFDSMDGGDPEFMPDESAILFRGSGDSGEIHIPPNWLERLHAKIP